MSRLTSLFPSGILGNSNNSGHRDRTTDGITRLRFTLETLPGAKKYVFSPSVKSDILTELYDTFWGQHATLLMPHGVTKMPPGILLSDLQIQYRYNGAGGEQPITPGRTCGHIFVKGESCYRCK